MKECRIWKNAKYMKERKNMKHLRIQKNAEYEITQTMKECRNMK